MSRYNQFYRSVKDLANGNLSVSSDDDCGWAGLPVWLSMRARIKLSWRLSTAVLSQNLI